MVKKLLWLTYQPYKWLIVIPFLLVSTCFFVFIGVLFIFLFNDRLANRTTGVWWARSVAWITPMLVTITGKENIQKERSYIIVANHQSNFDILLLFGWLGIDIKWVIKKELRRVPVFGYAAEKGGNILIDRSNPEEAHRSLRLAREKVRGGTSIVILPEGTRSRTGEMGQFKRGAFVLAMELGLPVLPVTLANTRGILPAGTLDLFPGRATMIIHEPVDSSRYTPDTCDEFREHVKEIIRQGLEKYQHGE
jgi:1-acyl-sn-glycerol-3-phosphate acyltransferase